jgi:hypothetical protein
MKYKLFVTYFAVILLQSCSLLPSPTSKITAGDVYLAFTKAGLEAENPHSLTKEDYGSAPYVCAGALFYIPSICGDCGGRIFECDNQNDINALATYYIQLGNSNPLLFSWIIIRNNILVQINGQLPEAMAIRYKEAIPGEGIITGNIPIGFDPNLSSQSPVSDIFNNEKPLPLELIESGYIIVEGPFVEYGFILRNPNENYVAMFPTIRITMRNSNGEVIGTMDQVLNRIMPGETVGWGGQGNPNGINPSQVSFEVIDPGNNWTPKDQVDPKDYKPFTTLSLNVNTNDFYTAFTGEIENQNNFTFQMVAISIILRNESGKIVVGYTGFIQGISAFGKAPFEVTSLGKVPAYTSFEAYVQQW